MATGKKWQNGQKMAMLPMLPIIGNIGNIAMLLEIAGLHGMDVPLLAELFESENDIEATRNDDAAARDLGVHGVPAFLAERSSPVSCSRSARRLAILPRD